MSERKNDSSVRTTCGHAAAHPYKDKIVCPKCGKRWPKR